MVEGDDLDLDSHCYNADTGEIVARGNMPDGTLTGGEFLLSGLPVGAKIYWQGEEYELNDDALSVLIDQPGTFTLTIMHPLFKTRVYTIENP